MYGGWRPPYERPGAALGSWRTAGPCWWRGEVLLQAMGAVPPPLVRSRTRWDRVNYRGAVKVVCCLNISTNASIVSIVFAEVAGTTDTRVTTNITVMTSTATTTKNTTTNNATLAGAVRIIYNICDYYHYLPAYTLFISSTLYGRGAGNLQGGPEHLI